MKVAVFFYTQSGQARKVAEAIWSDYQDVVFKEIVPEEHYPYPWSRREFFDVFPETRLGIPPSGIKPIDFSDIENADVVMIVGQSWFLSPSLPLQSFFADESVRMYLKGRNVVFVNACRNMWYKTGLKIKEYLADINAKYVGHIVLQDSAPNLISAITVVRWMMYGKKEATALLPMAGVKEEDIRRSSRFGKIIADAWKNGEMKDLQKNLLEAGAIRFKPSIVFIEQNGHSLFAKWAVFVRKMGRFREQKRRFRLDMFYVYLLFVLFVVSPFGQLFFYLTYPLHNVKKMLREGCEIVLNN